jgi:hypothetical protein
MRLYQLDISWAASAQELTALRCNSRAATRVGGVFLTGREDTLAVLYAGSSHDFDRWARTLEPHFQSRQQRSTEMRRFFLPLFALGFLIGAIIAAAASVGSAAAAKTAHAPRPWRPRRPTR